MNPKDQEVLNDILTKNPEDLNEYQVKFLKARSSYLNNEQKRIFEVILIDREVKKSVIA